MFFQGRPSSSQDARVILNDGVLPVPINELDAPNQGGANLSLPSTSTPIGNVQRSNINRGGSRGMVTRSAARYLSICLSLSLYLIVPLF